MEQARIQCGVRPVKTPTVLPFSPINRHTVLDPSRLVLQSIAFGKPIIAVNINYRLSIFGFAASSEIIQEQTDAGLRGCNFAIRDQKVGLQWVSQNIAAFGGDPAKITIGGQSAGGSSVHAHVLEAKLKAERPLFRNACIQSGAVGTLGPISMAKADESWEKLCQYFGIEKPEGRSRVESLQNITTEALSQAARDLSWDTCALVEDKITLTVMEEIGDHGIPFVFDFGEIGRSDHVAGPNLDGIRILIGDTEKDVRTLSFIVHLYQISDTSHRVVYSARRLQISKAVLSFNASSRRHFTRRF